MRVVYVDPFAGVSGDMFLGALVDAGWPIDRLQAVIQRLQLPDVTVTTATTYRNGLRGIRLNVATPESAVATSHADERAHNATPPHRGLADLLAIVRRGGWPTDVDERVTRVLTRLAEVEARIHGTTIEAVHFHEIGAVDTLVDVVGVIVGLAELRVERVISGPLPVGQGWVKSAHGPLPSPPPAVAALTVGAPTRGAPIEGELVTPTGAALVTTLAHGWGPQPAMTVTQVGYGAGAKTFAIPNLLRIFIGDLTEPDAGPNVVEIVETNIDDMNPEILAHVTARLFAAGALDVWTTPVGMKKGRAGVTLAVMADLATIDPILGVIFAETTTFGLRRRQDRRERLERSTVMAPTRFGSIAVKLGYWRGRLVSVSPEFEQCRAAALDHGAPLKVVYDAARRAAADLGYRESANDA